MPIDEGVKAMPVEPIADMPDWLPGRIDWHGWPVPLVAFGRLSGNANEPVALNSKIVVLKALSGDKDRPYFALLTPSFPRLVSVPRDGLLADATEEDLPVGVKVRVLLGDERDSMLRFAARADDVLRVRPLPGVHFTLENDVLTVCLGLSLTHTHVRYLVTTWENVG